MNRNAANLRRWALHHSKQTFNRIPGPSGVFLGSVPSWNQDNTGFGTHQIHSSPRMAALQIHKTVSPALRPAISTPSNRPRLTITAPRCAAVLNGTGSTWLNDSLKHVVESQQFSKETLRRVFEVSREMEDIRPNTDESRQLHGAIMSTLFYEPSTRTRLSFESAMARLGGTVLSTESAGEYSSAAKGETLEDTIRTIEGYADVIVLRHFQAGAAKRAASAASVPIINAGDGPGQHPTQALLDVYTIQREIGRLDNFTVGMVGDLANGRTVRSLAYVLSMYENVKMYFVAPDVVRMKPDILEYLSSVGVKWEEADDLRAVAAEVDVLYQTRIQKERFQDRPDDYERAKGKYIVDTELMKLLPKDSVVMHPLPRVDEISASVDTDPRAAYFRQARNGLYVRMALLKLCLQDRIK